MKCNPSALSDGSLSKRVCPDKEIPREHNSPDSLRGGGGKQIFVKSFLKIHNPLTIAGITVLFSGFCAAHPGHPVTPCSTTTTTWACTCTESDLLLPPTSSVIGCTTTPADTTPMVCADEEICSTLVGLCDCETPGLRETVRKSCPLMCNLCEVPTTTTTTTPEICEDKPVCADGCDCADKCNHPLVGPRLRKDCPVMCGVCGSTPTPTIAITTTTTTTIFYEPGVCKDDPTCDSECDCKDKCEHPLIGEHLRTICPEMCKQCEPTTTTTTASLCQDDINCPTLVDADGNPLCECESIGDMVRALCPVMCDVCHSCILPCLSGNLASKTILTKQEEQAGTCDDPAGIPKGHTCILTPTSPDPCLTGSVHWTCPSKSSNVAQMSKLQVHCQVCGGVTPQAGDIDSRAGHIEVQISWGPNMIDGIINEGVIKGYAVYAVNACRERQGSALATITTLKGIQEGTQDCCNEQTYKANILFQLPDGNTSQSFMVVPLTSVGALDVGWVTSAIDDFVDDSKAVTVSITLNSDYQQLSTHDKEELKGKVEDSFAISAGVDQSAVSVTLTPGSVNVEVRIEAADGLGVPEAIAIVEKMQDGSLSAESAFPEVQQVLQKIAPKNVLLLQTFKAFNWDESTGEFSLEKWEIDKLHQTLKELDANSAESIFKSMQDPNIAQVVLTIANSILGVKEAANGELKVTNHEVKMDDKVWKASSPNASSMQEQDQSQESGFNQLWLILILLVCVPASLFIFCRFLKKKSLPPPDDNATQQSPSAASSPKYERQVSPKTHESEKSIDENAPASNRSTRSTRSPPPVVDPNVEFFAEPAAEEEASPTLDDAAPPPAEEESPAQEAPAEEDEEKAEA